MNNPALWWLGLGLALMILEVVTTTLFCFWLSLAALFTAALCWLLTLGSNAQYGTFAMAVMVCIFCWQRFRPRRLEQARDGLVLNDRAGRYVGREVVLREALSQGQGRINIDDSWWQARGEDMPAGTRVRVESVEGMVLVLRRLE